MLVVSRGEMVYSRAGSKMLDPALDRKGGLCYYGEKTLDDRRD